MIIDGHDMPMGSGGDHQLLKGYHLMDRPSERGRAKYSGSSKIRI
jgi:hypothetical protein